MTYRDHVGRHETNTTSPSLRRLVQHIVHTESLVLSRQRVQILLQQNILLGHVGEDQVHFGTVTCGAAPDDSLDNLQHGGDARATGNHTKVANHVGCVHESALGSADADGLADGERGKVLADVAGGVGLDEQVEVAGLLVAADGGVGAYDFLVGAIWLGEHSADGDVLANGEAEDVVRALEGDAVALAHES